jgi:hypothetical protein
MIRAELDLARLATQAGGPLRLDADRTIRAGGVSITAADADDLHVEPDMAVVLRGRPHATGEPLASALALAPARALAAGLRADPAALLNQLHGRFALLWVDAAKGTCGFATDRFATHSLCHGSVDGRLVVAERADAVAPGAVDSTWMIEWTNEQRASSIDNALLKRRCTPEDIAEVMLFLLAGAAMVTGQTIVVDGGLTT